MDKTTFSIKEDGFCGQLFKSENELCPNKALILCTGSDGNVKFIEEISKLFAENGITTLGISFFNAPDASDTICEIPLEYIEKAAKYLKSVGYEKIGVWGVSMGSVYVLLCACYFPDLISFVVAASPLYFVYQAVDKNKCKLIDGKSAFSYRGEPIPFEPCLSKMSYFSFFINTLKKFEPNYANLYDPLVGKATENHIIPVEKMKASLLLISGKMDTLWPSTKSADMIVERLKEKKYPYPYEHVAFEHGGHFMIPIYNSFERFLRANRKFPEDNEKYRNEHLQKVIEGFKNF